MHLSAWDLKYNLWLPSHRLLSNQSPYQSGVWFPQAIGAFNPLGWLDEYQASLLWLALSLVLLGVMTWMMGARSPAPFGLSLGALLVFPQTMTHLLLGQFTIFAIVLLLTSVYFVTRHSLWIAGFLVAVAFAKPQIAVLVLPGLVILAYRSGKWRSVFRFAVACVAAGVLLTVPLWLLYPQWLGDFLLMQGTKPEWYQPNLFVMLRLWLGVPGLYVWLALSAIVFAVNARLWFSLEPLYAATWSLALTVLVSPYIWSWDFVLILPLFVYLIVHLPPAARVVLSGTYMLLWLLNWQIRLSVDGGEERFWIIPLLFVLVFACYGCNTSAVKLTVTPRTNSPSRSEKDGRAITAR